MIVFDIDNTISPTDMDYKWEVDHEIKYAWGMNVGIPSHILDFLRSRDDIVFLSTWGAASRHLCEAFGFKAQIIVMTEEQIGIAGKFDAIQNLDGVTAWIDDHIKPAMKSAMEAKGATVIKPTNGFISERQLNALKASLS